MLFLTPEHIFITFAFEGSQKAFATSVQTQSLFNVEKQMRSANSLTTESHVGTNIHTINLAIVLNERVYSKKIKLLIKQIQSQNFFLIFQT